MAIIDYITDAARRITPGKSASAIPSTSLSGGIGNGHGIVEDDMIVSKPAIIFHTSQVFFNFLAMCCFASVAAFQAKWGVGPSGLTGFALFCTIAGMLLSLFMLLVPVIYEKYDRLARLSRALMEDRVGFILTGAGSTVSLLIAFIITISAWTEPGCKNAKNDPNAKAKGDDFTNGLPGWCNTKKAGAIFLWLAFAFWAATLVQLVLRWRSNRSRRPRDPPFQRPGSMHGVDDLEDGEYDMADHDDDRASSAFHAPAPTSTSGAYTSDAPPRIPPVGTDNSNAYDSPFRDGGFAPPRQSMDAYGAFSDPAPSGYAAPPPASGGYAAPPPPAGGYAGGGGPSAPTASAPGVAPGVSRTMQYADPYAAVRASIGAPAAAAPPPGTPPSYESYQGYR